MKDKTCKKRHAAGAIRATTRKIFSICGVFAVIGALLIVPAHALVPTTGISMINFMNAAALNNQIMYETSNNANIGTLQYWTNSTHREARINFTEIDILYEMTNGATEDTKVILNTKVKDLFPHCVDNQTYYLCFNSAGIYPSKVYWGASSALDTTVADEITFGTIGTAIIWNDPQAAFQNYKEWYITISFQPDCLTRIDNVYLSYPYMTQNKYTGTGGLAYAWSEYNAVYWQDNYQEGYDTGYDIGYVRGNAQGYTTGKEEGRTEGYQEGYNTGYTAGQTAGQTAGYQTGYQEGYNTAYQKAIADQANFKSSIFADAKTFSATAYFDNSAQTQTYTKTFTPDYITGGIFFKTLKDELVEEVGQENWELVDQVYITITWENDKAWDWQQFPLFINGESLVSSGEIATTESKRYAIDANQESTYRKFEIITENVTYPVIVNEVKIQVGRPEDLLANFYLLSDSQMFQLGYTAGYTEGMTTDTAGAYEKGKTEGYNEGFTKGKQEGMNISKTGDWKSLVIAVVEAPINTFQSLFNFEILGMDMRVAFGSIIALCILLIIIKKALI